MSEDGGTLQGKRILVAGASGTIGRAVVRALIADEHHVTALMRGGSDGSTYAAIPELSGAAITSATLGDGDDVARVFEQGRFDTVISCIASRSGAAKDALAVDYEANLKLLNAALQAEADHFILLSAICVQRPMLAFQREKLRFESELRNAAIDHTIVRPTAFFKSLSGQVERVRAGKKFLLFGDGELTRCKPISDGDLGRFIADCVTKPERRGAILPIGGPGPAISLRQQGELLFEEAGMEPRFQSVPVAMFNAAVAVLSLGERLSDWFAAKAEYARIGRYYATESMLVFNQETGEYDAEATPEFGEETLRDHYRALLVQDQGLRQGPDTKSAV